MSGKSEAEQPQQINPVIADLARKIAGLEIRNSDLSVQLSMAKQEIQRLVAQNAAAPVPPVPPAPKSKMASLNG